MVIKLQCKHRNLHRQRCNKNNNNIFIFLVHLTNEYFFRKQQYGSINQLQEQGIYFDFFHS